MKEKSINRLDKVSRYAVMAVLFTGIAVFLIALFLNFKLVMGVISGFVILGALGATAKVM